MLLPIYTTEATDALCKEVAKKSHGVVFAGFSGGKDSVCMLLQLSRYFKRIIPFHCASIPNMAFRSKLLDYYEYEFQTKILRLMGEDLSMSMRRLIYQEPRDAIACLEEYGDVEDYNKLDILEYLRKMFNLPRAWCAFGVNACDSIDRRIYCNKTGGKSDANRTFYPCWDWPRQEILTALTESGLQLAPEYKYTKRSMGGPPCATYNKVLREHFPEDYKKMKAWYPLCELKTRREDRLEQRWLKKLDDAAASNGGKENSVAPKAEAIRPAGDTDAQEPEIKYESPDSGIYIAPDIDDEEAEGGEE